MRSLQNGFSFLELVIVLAISATLLGFAVPSMKSFLGDSEMSATNNHFVYSLQSARSEAIKRTTAVALCPSTNPLAVAPACSGSDYAQGWIVFVDSNGNGTREATDELVLQSEAVSSEFTFTADTVFTDRIYFGSSGTSSNPAGIPLSGVVRIDFAGGSEKRDITIAANGRITTKEVVGTATP